MMAFMRTTGATLALKSIPQGAPTQVYVATLPAAAATAGADGSDCDIDRASAKGKTTRWPQRCGPKPRRW